LHCRFVCQPRSNFTKDIGGVRITWLNDAVVNPLAFPPSGNHTRSPQVGKMTGDLWLVCLQNFYKETDTNFVLSHKVNQSQTRAIRQRSKEERDVIFPASHCVPLRTFAWFSYYDFAE
jgi:hypothetical protein